MGKSLILLLLLQLVLIALNAIFACAEIAVLSVNETKLDRMAAAGNRKAKRLVKLTNEPAKFLATIQVAITLSGFLGSAFAADNFSEPLVDWLLQSGLPLSREVLDSVSVVVITLILSYFTLIFGELVPKRLAMKKAESIAMGISGIVSGISVVFKPVVWFLSVSTNLVLRLCGVDPHQAEDDVSEEEIRMMVDAGEEKGTIDTQEKEFIQNVFEFNDITAGNIATHRTDVVILWLEDDNEVWEKTIHHHRYTLYPVCGDSADDVVGVLNAKDYFRLESHDRDTVMAEAVRNAYFVPRTLTADALFRNMRTAHQPMAIVVDEYGGMEGIVTQNDLLEELVGELVETPADTVQPEPSITQVDDTTWHIAGNVELRDLEEKTGLELVTEDYDTLTGLVFEQLGAIPADGDQHTEVDGDRYTVCITKMEERQIVTATFTVKSEDAAAPEDA